MAMTARITATALLALTVTGSYSPACAADERANVRHERIYLLQADARDVARMFGLAARTRSQRHPAAAQRRPGIGPSGLVHPDAKPNRSRPPQLVAWAGFPGQHEQFTDPMISSGGFGGTRGPDLLPGQMKPPIPIPGHNALLVTGTPAEIDEFREMLRLFDVPSAQVRIRADIVNVLARIEEALGLDWGWTGGSAAAKAGGNAPPDASIALRFALANFAAALGAAQRQTRGMERTGVMDDSELLVFVTPTILRPIAKR